MPFFSPRNRIIPLCALLSAVLAGAASTDARGSAPRVSCGNVSGLAIENLVCQDEELARLDRRLSELMERARAAPRLGEATLKRLRLTGRKWRETRDQCWRADSPRQCALEQYRRRIVRLQVELALLKPSRVERYRCRGEVLTLRFYEAVAPALSAGFRGGEDVFMLRDRNGAPGRYVGAFLSLSIRPSELLLYRAGTGAAALRCHARDGNASETGRRTTFAECGDRP